jgi:hypothetical protein
LVAECPPEKACEVVVRVIEEVTALYLLLAFSMAVVPAVDRAGSTNLRRRCFQGLFVRAARLVEEVEAPSIVSRWPMAGLEQFH